MPLRSLNDDPGSAGATLDDDGRYPQDSSNDVRHQQAVLQRAFGRSATTEHSDKRATQMLLLEGVHDRAVRLFADAGYTHISRIKEALEGEVLRERARGVSIIGVRSRTQLRARDIAAFDRLLAIGCFSAGTNQVDLEAARDRGIPVFNAPFANTRSVAELVMGEIIMLFRGIFPRSAAAHLGEWRKSAAGSHEIRGKTLGIVGYGNIGSQLSYMAEALGMRVMYFDIVEKLRYGNVIRAETLTELLALSDVVSLHVPGTPSTNRMIGRAELAAMHSGSYLINSSRGSVVDLEALADELGSGRLGGAAVDVFPVEPSSNVEVLLTPLRGLANVILTPHIGGSTGEAQERIGEEVARKLLDFVVRGSTVGAVNFPQVQLPGQASGVRFIQVHRRAAGMIGRLCDVFARRNIGIAAQYCRTDGEIGYAVIDVADIDEGNAAILDEINALEGTIRARVV